MRSVFEALKRSTNWHKNGSTVPYWIGGCYQEWLHIHTAACNECNMFKDYSWMFPTALDSNFLANQVVTISVPLILAKSVPI